MKIDTDNSYTILYNKYLLSSAGYVQNMKTKRILKGPVITLYNSEKDSSDSGYKINVRLNSLVAEHFLPNKYNWKFVRHLNGNEEDCSVNNLEWSLTAEKEDKKIYKLIHVNRGLYLFRSIADAIEKTGIDYWRLRRLLRDETLQIEDWFSVNKVKGLCA